MCESKSFILNITYSSRTIYVLVQSRMNVSNVPARVMKSVDLIIQDLYDSQFAEHNVDLQVDVVGALNYTTGIKLRMTFVDSFEDADVDEWRTIAQQHGATSIRTRVNTSSGNIDLNIEYKSKPTTKVNKIWIARTVLALLASWSYQQLHLLESERYPLPTEWFA